MCNTLFIVMGKSPLPFVSIFLSKLNTSLMISTVDPCIDVPKERAAVISHSLSLFLFRNNERVQILENWSPDTGLSNQ